MTELERRLVHRRPRRLVERPVGDIADDADDLGHLRIAVHDFRQRDAKADRIPIRKEAACRGIADDHDLGPPASIVGSEAASAHDRDLQRAKMVGADAVPARHEHVRRSSAAVPRSRSRASRTGIQTACTAPR